MAAEPPIRVVIVDDHQMPVQGLKAVLGSESGIDVVATAHKATEEVADAVRGANAGERLVLSLHTIRNHVQKVNRGP